MHCYLNRIVKCISKICIALFRRYTLKKKKKKKKPSSKWIDSSSEGHLQGFSLILMDSSSKIVNWIRGQRSNKSLIFVRNIEVGFLFLFVIFVMSIKLLFDLWPLIQFTIFEEEPCQIEEEPCKCPSEEESIHFEEVFLECSVSFKYAVLLSIWY